MGKIKKMNQRSESEIDTGEPDPKRTANTVHVRLPLEHIKGIDRIAKENGISRASVVAIAVSRILKSGL